MQAGRSLLERKAHTVRNEAWGGTFLQSEDKAWSSPKTLSFMSPSSPGTFERGFTHVIEAKRPEDEARCCTRETELCRRNLELAVSMNLQGSQMV
jgi:hypothetical protein